MAYFGCGKLGIVCSFNETHTQPSEFLSNSYCLMLESHEKRLVMTFDLFLYSSGHHTFYNLLASRKQSKEEYK